jgi:hypothetical protein
MTLARQDLLSAYELAKREAAKDFTEYLRIISRKYIVSRMHRKIGQTLEKVLTGEIKRLIITTPPRHGKSQLCGVRFPSYALGRNPYLKLIIASHRSDLSENFSRECRDIVWSQLYSDIFPETRVRQDMKKPEEWQTTLGGGYQAVGVNTGLSGWGGDILVVDDMFADYAQANSPVVREKVWRWFTSTARTRLSPGGAIIVIATRWNQEDLIGRLMDPKRRMEMVESGVDQMPWTVLELPAFARQNDILGRQPGEALFPERWTREELLKSKAEMTRFDWAALYECVPVPEGGNLIDVSKFKLREPHEVPPNQRYSRAWDLATDDKTWMDETAGAYGFMHGGEFWIQDITVGQWKWPHARDRIKMIGQQERCVIGIEAVGGFKTSAQNLKEVSPTLVIRELTVSKDKVARAQQWLALLDNGKVNLVKGPWVNRFLNSCQPWPNGEKMDEVDAVSLLHFMLCSIGSGGSVIDKKVDTGIRMEKFPRHGRTGF